MWIYGVFVYGIFILPVLLFLLIFFCYLFLLYLRDNHQIKLYEISKHRTKSCFAISLVLFIILTYFAKINLFGLIYTFILLNSISLLILFVLLFIFGKNERFANIAKAYLYYSMMFLIFCICCFFIHIFSNIF